MRFGGFCRPLDQWPGHLGLCNGHDLFQIVGPHGKVGRPLLQRFFAGKAGNFMGIVRVGRYSFDGGHAAGLAAHQCMQVRGYGNFFTGRHG